jgi:LysR family transcriptional activator of nhaA
MSHINYNHLYYFWHVYKEGSVVGAAEALFLTPQTITGQIKALEERLQGKLFKRKEGAGAERTGELVFRYADRMFTLSQEMLDIVNYRKESNLLFDVGVADALSAAGQRRAGCRRRRKRADPSALF